MHDLQDLQSRLQAALGTASPFTRRIFLSFREDVLFLAMVALLFWSSRRLKLYEHITG